MPVALFRFYSGLNDFLPEQQRQETIPCEFNGPQTVKHLIESLGIPHPEVALILVNDQAVRFSYRPRNGDRIAVYPEWHQIDTTSFLPLRPPVPEPPAFLADNHLGRLVRYLRLLGFDTVNGNQIDDDALAQQAHDENRIMLTRDRGLLKRSLVTWGYCLRTTDSRQQLFDVLQRFRLYDQIVPWTRCLRCNGRLHSVDKMAVWDLLEPKTRLYYDEFQQCNRCGQIYWQGSHFDKLRDMVTEAHKIAKGLSNGESFDSPA